ncbi:hypothetical protein ACIQRZ_18880 [Streptomyces rubiginosohelvolus]|uniref:hypothetical protein n=1 Tax=Streptomyces rubiginosohelvolus TaxID=67362 RepID=UPI0037FEEF32
MSLSLPGFPSRLLDQHGLPLWISDLTTPADRTEVLHVVRDLHPVDAIRNMVADADFIHPLESRSARHFQGNPISEAIANGEDCEGVIMAGLSGRWTFLYDNMGLASSGFETQDFSERGGISAMVEQSINGFSRLCYSTEGRRATAIIHEDFDPGVDLARMPSELADACAAASRYKANDAIPKATDINMFTRALCIMADLIFASEQLNNVPLWIARY